MPSRSIFLRAFPAFITLLLAASLSAQTFAPVGPIAFTKPFAGANPLPQIIPINSIGAAFAFTSAATTSTGGNWLSLYVGAGCTGGGSCSTPHPITAIVNADVILAAGTYSGQIVVTSSNAQASMTIPVTLTVAAVSTPFFDNLPGELTFFFKTGGAASPSQSFQVRNGGTGSLPWTVTATTADGGNWLNVSPGSGTAPSQVTASIVKQNLPNAGNGAGTFIGKLLFQTPGGGSATIPISVAVGDAVFDQQNPISFTKVFAGANPLPQTLAISSAGTEFSVFAGENTATGGDWLNISLGSGCTGGGVCATPQTLTVIPNPVITLPVGSYTSQIAIHSSTGSIVMLVPVNLTVAPASAPFFDNVPGRLSFSLKTSGNAPPSQIVRIGNGASTGSLAWTLTATTSDGGNWLTVSTTSGTAPSEIVVGINPANLPTVLTEGTYTGQLLFQAAGSSVTVPISVHVAADVLNQINPISFTKVFAGEDPLPKTITVSSSGAPISFSTAEYTATGGDWLAVSLGGGCTGGGVCATPHAATATVNASPTLPVGTYTGEIVLTATDGEASITVPVTLTVVPAATPFIDGLPGQLSFFMKTAGTNPPSQPVEIRNGGSGALNWTLQVSTADGGNWLSASAAAGTAPSTVSVSVNKANLPGLGLLAGTFNGQLLFQSPTGGSATVLVSFTVGADVFQQVNPIQFTKLVGGANPLPQTLTVTSTGAAVAFVTATSTSTGGNWLSAQLFGGCTGGGVCGTPQAIQATVNADVTLPAGTYTGQIVLTSTEGAMTIPVTLTVSPGSGPVFDNIPGQMSFSMLTGASTNPTSQTVQIRNAGAGGLTYAFSASTADGGNWLTVSAAGVAPSTATVGVITANLPNAGLIAGIFTGTISFESGTGKVTVPVSVVVGTTSFVQLAPLTFTKAFGAQNPLPQTLSLTDNGVRLSFFTMATSGNGGNWLTANIGGGCSGGGVCGTPHTVTATANPATTLAAGTYTGQIVFNTSDIAMTVPVYLTIVAQTPASVTATGGTPQSATINTAFASQFVVTVRDSSNSPMSGVTVTFTAPASGASGTFAGGVNTAVTNAQGQATSAVFTANGATGSYSVAASVAGVATPATFALTNNAVVITCVTNISPPSANVGPSQSRATFTITTTPGCNWTASSSASWFEIFPITGTNSASIEWTVYPNFGTQPRTTTATVGNRTFTITQAAGFETVLQRFVRLLYFSFLGRTATDQEVAVQVNSGSTRAQLATNFLNSAEFNLGGRFAAGLYVAIIDRDAEFTGWQFQRQALARGIVNQDQLVSNFLNSQEFILKFGVLSDAAFVRLMYQNVLLRPASQSEVDAWVNVLSNPANTRTIIARSFLNSPEFQNGTGPRLLAFLLYSTLLLRDATAPQRAALEAELANPAQLPVTISTFANGAEINALLQ